PIPADTSPATLSLGYIADSDQEEDPEEDHADYPADRGDDDDGSSDDDDEDDNDVEEDDEEEEEHPALADSSSVPVDDHVPSSLTHLFIPIRSHEGSSGFLMRNYVPGPEEPEQAPLSPNYVHEHEYPEYLTPSNDEVPIED
nr:hypothetical protein [Tanacetum cinerariifolium]